MSPLKEQYEKECGDSSGSFMCYVYASTDKYVDWLEAKVEILTASNKESTQCQHVFYSIKFAGKVRCNKCEAEFPVISTC